MRQTFQPKNKLLATLLLLLGLTVLLMVFVRTSSHHSPFHRTFEKAQGDTLDIGIELNPTIYFVSGDSIYGRDYEILQRISRRHGVPMKFHPFVPLRHAMEQLDHGMYDILVASMPVTADLKERYLMSDPVYLDREILVQRVDSAGHAAITSQLQLGGDTVWIPSDSSIAERIDNLASEIGDTIYVQSDPAYTAEHLLLLVAQGVIDLAVINENIAKAMAADYPQVDISTPVSFNQFQAWAFNRGNEALRDSINLWLKE